MKKQKRETLMIPFVVLCSLCTGKGSLARIRNVAKT
jgi:hypothetical protein